MPRRSEIRGSEVGRLSQQERKGSLGTKREGLGNLFPSKESSPNSAPYVSENGEDALLAASRTDAPYFTCSSFSTFITRRASRPG